ncbi:uncharacterized protein EI90DRAFT_3014565 [Cantharellus anzutake]|uniref:uncharacterized protein n=1 Tax=Cantharellus anzutake TaxID=1750568 RepID=UPI0019075E02|nr:uncharacterized protein EI90DRAFT_3014565 [Cantharellus anzutake]KAF8335996.1 hypothetical protein EI90DRAFT_3014565 [Cantharellus anzutake]
MSFDTPVTAGPTVGSASMGECQALCAAHHYRSKMVMLSSVATRPLPWTSSIQARGTWSHWNRVISCMKHYIGHTKLSVPHCRERRERVVKHPNHHLGPFTIQGHVLESKQDKSRLDRRMSTCAEPTPLTVFIAHRGIQGLTTSYDHAKSEGGHPRPGSRLEERPGTLKLLHMIWHSVSSRQLARNESSLVLVFPEVANTNASAEGVILILLKAASNGQQGGRKPSKMDECLGLGQRLEIWWSFPSQESHVARRIGPLATFDHRPLDLKLRAFKAVGHICDVGIVYTESGEL